MTRVLARVRGRVQGVGFREFTRRRADALGLAGWVRNLPDGRVEACFEGSSAAASALLEALHEGPRWSEVEGVEVVHRESPTAASAAAPADASDAGGEPLPQAFEVRFR